MRWRLRGYLRRTITYPWARRIVVAVIGGSIVLLGIAMVVLPGPAIVFIPLGLGVLGLEFAWARHWLRKLRATATDVVSRVRGRPKVSTTTTRPPPPGRRTALIAMTVRVNGPRPHERRDPPDASRLALEAGLDRGERLRERARGL